MERSLLKNKRDQIKENEETFACFGLYLITEELKDGIGSNIRTR